MQIDVHYPDRASERRVLLETTGDAVATPTQALNAGELESIQRLVRRLPVGDAVVDAILDLVRAARPDSGDPAIAPHVAWGPGPRAAQALMLATRARALATGRLAPSLDDVAALAAPVLRHRMALNFAARRDMNVEDIIRKLIARIG
jgi:MoxR-like ATPase